MTEYFKYTLDAKDGRARAGRFSPPHGEPIVVVEDGMMGMVSDLPGP